MPASPGHRGCGAWWRSWSHEQGSTARPCVSPPICACPIPSRRWRCAPADRNGSSPPPRQQLGQLLSRWPHGERPPSMLESFHRHSGHMAISAITLSELLQCCPMAPRHPCITARSALPWNAGNADRRERSPHRRPRPQRRPHPGDQRPAVQQVGERLLHQGHDRGSGGPVGEPQHFEPNQSRALAPQTARRVGCPLKN